MVEEDTQSWGGTWHKFTPNPTIICIGMALEGGARAPGAPLLPPPMFLHEHDHEHTNEAATVQLQIFVVQCFRD